MLLKFFKLLLMLKKVRKDFKKLGKLFQKKFKNLSSLQLKVKQVETMIILIS